MSDERLVSACQGAALLSELGLHPKLQWVQSLLDSGIDDATGAQSSFLDSDIESTSDPRERAAVLGSTSCHTLPSAIIVQVDEVADISLPQSARCRLEVSDSPTFKLLLNDAGVVYIGLAGWPIRGLAPDCAGAKIRIAAGTPTVYGVFLLDDDNARGLGGFSPEMVARREDFISARSRRAAADSFEGNCDLALRELPSGFFLDEPEVEFLFPEPADTPAVPPDSAEPKMRSEEAGSKCAPRAAPTRPPKLEPRSQGTVLRSDDPRRRTHSESQAIDRAAQPDMRTPCPTSSSSQPPSRSALTPPPPPPDFQRRTESQRPGRVLPSETAPHSTVDPRVAPTKPESRQRPPLAEVQSQPPPRRARDVGRTPLRALEPEELLLIPEMPRTVLLRVNSGVFCVQDFGFESGGAHFSANLDGRIVIPVKPSLARLLIGATRDDWLALPPDLQDEIFNEECDAKLQALRPPLAVIDIGFGDVSTRFSLTTAAHEADASRF
jgi:hypothetical protein